MATKARKIPQDNWDHHKETILNLYLTSDLSVGQLVQTMDEQHGFRATISQYEAQLKSWDARKNLKAHEWKRIFEIIDHLSSQDTQSRVVISGHPVSVDKVNRARRHCNSETRLGKRRRVEIDSSHTSNGHGACEAFIETQKPNGEWCQYRSDSINQLDQDVAVELVSQERIIDIDANQERPGSNDVVDYPYLQGLVNSPPGSFSFHISQYSSGSYSESNDVNNVTHPTENSINDPGSQFVQDLIDYDFNADIISPGAEMATSPFRLDATGHLSFGMMCINDLPFERFERDSALKRLVLASHSSPLQESALLFGTQTLVMKFVVEVATSMSETNRKPPTQNLDKVWFTLQKLKSLLPTIQQGSTTTDLARSSHEIHEIELRRILLFSVANGFVGQDGLPLKLVFTFLDKHSNVNSLLSRWFEGIPDHFAKGLAENLFRASIEAGNHQAVRFFLQKRLVDVDNTFCFVDGKMYTPLERAAKLRELKVVHELLQAGPNVNISRLEIHDYDGIDGRFALRCLIYVSKFKRHPTGYSFEYKSNQIFSPEYLKTVDALIDAGLRVSISFIRLSLERYMRVDLAKKLLSRLAPSDYFEAIFEGILYLIILKFNAEDALEYATKIVSYCAKTGHKKCSGSFSDEMNWAAIAAAKQGNHQLVQFLFQYVKSLTQILSAAIRGGNYELIEFILEQNPNIHQAPPECINKVEPYTDMEFLSYTTPLAEAIESRDAILIKKLEDKGALENLSDFLVALTIFRPNRFESALLASSRVGNIEYMEKLLSCNVAISSRIAAEALLEVVRQRREDMVWLLLSWGIYVDVNVDAKFLRIVVELYKWNMPILYEIMATFPGLFFDGGSSDSSMERDLKSEPLHLLEFLCEHNFLYAWNIDTIYNVIVERSDFSMIRHAYRVGMNINGTNSLLAASKGHPDVLCKLLAQLASTQEAIHQFGTGAVVTALQGGDVGSLDILLACKAVDLKHVDPVSGTPLEVAVNIEAVGGCSHFLLISKLLDAGCDVNESTPLLSNKVRRRQYNMTPLLRAIDVGNKNLVQYLIDRGADVNKGAIHGITRTPLQMAAETADLAIAELLLRNGADVNAKPSTYMGGTALQLAAKGGNYNIAALLIDRGASIHDAPSRFDGRWPLEAAAEYGRLDMIQFLWNASLGGFPIAQCRKAIELAEKNGHRACRDLIRELAASSGIMLTLENLG
ncbi:uncharacterized protein F4812DRAFT_373761 [Daldinia caldariorum]|uniref:uncharacterized protein n=1 Tax=Daldinia caldariorum TaxID=326644 RepID=UPI002008D156|nr:uncharacterized protein F4812DRAFT_373761 [Daldinia caldariorum]KAI1468575.1 hypothetical protein F4812DRAFT_373761 [Daldinia caldariorum]